MVEEKVEVKLPTIWTDEAAEVQKIREKKGRRKEDQRRERVRRKKIKVRGKVWKSRFTNFFPMFCGSGGPQSRLAKAAGAEPSGQTGDPKLCGAVAQSRFGSQNDRSTSLSGRFWKLRCWKSTKHISKSKRRKHTNVGALLEVPLLNKSTVLWRWTCLKHCGLGALLSLSCSKSTLCCGAKHTWKSKCQWQTCLSHFSKCRYQLSTVARSR